MNMDHHLRDLTVAKETQLQLEREREREREREGGGGREGGRENHLIIWIVTS